MCQSDDMLCLAYRGEANGGDNQNRGPRQTYPLGYKAMQSLLDKDPDEAAVELGSLKRGLEKRLEAEDVRYDMVSLVFQVLHHFCFYPSIVPSPTPSIVAFQLLNIYGFY